MYNRRPPSPCPLEVSLRMPVIAWESLVSLWIPRWLCAPKWLMVRACVLSLGIYWQDQGVHGLGNLCQGGAELSDTAAWLWQCSAVGSVTMCPSKWCHKIQLPAWSPERMDGSTSLLFYKIYTGSQCTRESNTELSASCIKPYTALTHQSAWKGCWPSNKLPGHSVQAMMLPDWYRLFQDPQTNMVTNAFPLQHPNSGTHSPQKCVPNHPLAVKVGFWTPRFQAMNLIFCPHRTLTLLISTKKSTFPYGTFWELQLCWWPRVCKIVIVLLQRSAAPRGVHATRQSTNVTADVMTVSHLHNECMWRYHCADNLYVTEFIFVCTNRPTILSTSRNDWLFHNRYNVTTGYVRYLTKEPS